MRSLISLVISIACIALCGATLFHPIPHTSKVPLFKINEATGCLEFNRALLDSSHHTTGYVYSTGNKKETSHHQSSTTFHQAPIVAHTETKSVNIPVVGQFPTERIDTPFHEASPIIIAESTEYEKNVNLLQTLSAQRDVITSQIEHMAEFQKLDTKQSETMSSLLRRREFLNFQINSLVSLMGLETKYTTQFQVVGPSPQVQQQQAPVVPEYVEKKLFLEPSDNTYSIYPPTPITSQTFHSSSIESHEPVSHPNLLSALESQRDAITEALSRLTHRHSQENTNLYEFYTARRDIITAQIEHLKELQKDHATTTDTQKPALADQNQTNVHLEEKLSDSAILQRFEQNSTPVMVQFPTERIDIPFHEATPHVIAESSEYDKNVNLLQTLSAQRDGITSQIEGMAEIQKLDTEQSEAMSSLLRRREFLNFQINSLVSLMGLETKYTTQFQVVGPSPQVQQVVPEYVEKKLLFLEPSDNTYSIYPPTPMTSQTFHSSSIESHEPVSHPNLLSALESQRDAINEALSRLTHKHSQENTNLYEFYTARRDIITAQIEHLKELQKDHATTTDTQKPALADQNQTNVHLEEKLSDSAILQRFEENTTPVMVQFPTERIDIPFHEATPHVIAESSEYDKNVNLLQTLSAQRDGITSQIEGMAEIQELDTEQSEAMSSLLRRREFLNFQINSLVSLMGLETKYTTQFQVVGPSPQVQQVVPEYVEKKLLFLEPSDNTYSIYPPTPMTSQTFHSSSIESHEPVSHPNLLSALESQRDAINEALSRLTHKHSQENTNLYEFYTARRDIITAQIEHLKELQKDHATTTDTQKPALADQNQTNVHLEEKLSDSAILQRFEQNSTPVMVQFPTERIDIPFHEATPHVIAESSEYDKNVNLLQTLSAQRDGITSQIEGMAEIQELDTEQSEAMSSLLRRREFLNFQINSLVSLMGLETKYTTQFQVVGPSPQVQQVVPEYVEKKLLFLEPSDNTYSIYPPTPMTSQTFHSSSIESHEPVSHPNLLSALESQRDAINEALSRLTHKHSQENTNLYEFYTARRDIITAQIEHLKELQKDHATTTDTQKPALADQNQTNVHLEEKLSDSAILQRFEQNSTPVMVQFPTERIDIPFHEATPHVIAESSEYDKNVNLLQTLSAQRDGITSQIEGMAEIQKLDTEQSEAMSSLLRRREFLNFQINSLVSLMGLETKYTTQFQVVGPSPQVQQVVPEYVEKKLLFLEPSDNIHSIYPPTPITSQTFHSSSIESHEPVSHPNLLSALESQRDAINEALSRLTHRHSQENTNLYEFYTARRDIITAQIEHLKELQKDHATTTDTQKPALADQNQTNVHLEEKLSDSAILQRFEQNSTPVMVQFPTERIDIPFHEATPHVIAESSEYEKNVNLLQTLSAQRDGITSQIEGMAEIQELDTEQSKAMSSLLRRREFLNFQINSLVSLMGLETKYTTQFQVVGPSPQVQQQQAPVVPEYGEKKLFLEPSENIHSIYPPTSIIAQTFQSPSIESHEIASHPNLLSALESQRDAINDALLRLTHRHSQGKTNLYDFYAARRDIINAQIEHLKELQKDHANVHLGERLSDSAIQKYFEETTTHSSTTKKTPETTTTKSKPVSVEEHNKHTAEAQEGDLLAVLVKVRDSLQKQILLLERGDMHQQKKGEDKVSLLKALRAKCDQIDLQISHATGNFSTRLSSTISKQVSTKTKKVVETKKHTEHTVVPHEDIVISRRYLPTF